MSSDVVIVDPPKSAIAAVNPIADAKTSSFVMSKTTIVRNCTDIANALTLPINPKPNDEYFVTNEAPSSTLWIYSSPGTTDASTARIDGKSVYRLGSGCSATFVCSANAATTGATWFSKGLSGNGKPVFPIQNADITGAVMPEMYGHVVAIQADIKANHTYTFPAADSNEGAEVKFVVTGAPGAFNMIFTCAAGELYGMFFTEGPTVTAEADRYVLKSAATTVTLAGGRAPIGTWVKFTCDGVHWIGEGHSLHNTVAQPSWA